MAEDSVVGIAPGLPSLDFGGPFIMFAIIIGFAILGVLLYGFITWKSFNLRAIYYRRRGEEDYLKEVAFLRIGKRKDGSLCLEERSSFFNNILGKTRKFPMIDYKEIKKGMDIDLYFSSPDECHPLKLNKDYKLEPIINSGIKAAYFRQLEEDQKWNLTSSFWSSPAGMMMMVFGIGIIMVIALAVWAPEASKAAGYAASASADNKYIFEKIWNATEGKAFILNKTGAIGNNRPPGS